MANAAKYGTPPGATSPICLLVPGYCVATAYARAAERTRFESAAARRDAERSLSATSEAGGAAIRETFDSLSENAVDVIEAGNDAAQTQVIGLAVGTVAIIAICVTVIYVVKRVVP